MSSEIERIISDTPYIWDKLSGCTRPVLIYGTGNGADKIIDLCNANNVTVSGVFASDGFVRSRDFRSHHVISYGDAVSRFGDDIVILAAFGSTLPDVIEYFYSLSAKHEFYLPYAPLYGGEIFSPLSLTRDRAKLEAAYSFFADEYSRTVFESVLRYRLSGKIEFLKATEAPETSYKTLFDRDITKILDLGAFKGDSARMLLGVFPSCKTLIAVEPDAKSFSKLSDYAVAEEGCRVIPINAAISDKCGTAEFIGGGSRGAAIGGSSKRAIKTAVKAVTIDELSRDLKPDLIKLDTEGYEDKALSGGICTLRECSPSLAVSVYHKSYDIYELPLKVHELMPDKKLYLRRAPCLPDWDITLFAV